MNSISLWDMLLALINKQINPIELINLWSIILTLIIVILLGIYLKASYS